MNKMMSNLLQIDFWMRTKNEKENSNKMKKKMMPIQTFFVQKCSYWHQEEGNAVVFLKAASKKEA